MDLVAGAMGKLAPKLLQLLQDEYKLHKGLRKKIQFLSEELESIHAALRKVAAVPPEQLDEQVKIWARQIREASYDMEDILDTFLVRVEGRPDQGRLKSSVKRMGMLFIQANANHGIASAIENIDKQIQEVSERRVRYKVDDIVARPAATSTVDPRLEVMYKEVTELVSIDGAMGELKQMLFSSDKLNIVSVLGIGGLGKTTLAKAVYDKLKKSQFDCGAFVPVGRNPDLKKVFRDILIDLDMHKYTVKVNVSIMDERQLINELREFLRSKRYIIVIDDIWEIKSWKTIRLAFIDNNRGSRVITTTRKSEVTSGNKVYKPKPLSDDKSKKLFYRRIFGGEGKCPDNEVDKVSDEILKKCGGIPLAIITMASLLVGKSRGEWSEVCNSFGFHDKDIEQVDKTMWILSLSYYDLPFHLRTCLLYISAFPEDYTIDKRSLIWMWVAEDFVHKKQGIGPFEVGEGYFNELVNRSLIQAVESKQDGMVHGCRVHDMVLDLLRSLSREENFVTLLDNDEGTSFISSAHRLAFQKSKIDARLGNNEHMEKMRSFIAHRCDKGKELSFLSFKLLRVLDLEAIYMESWHNAKHLGNLLHLRYLGLKDTNMPELPKEIGALRFLQTLDLVKNLFEKELPSSIGQLTQLVCLRAWSRSRGVDSMPDGVIKKLTSLEELEAHVRVHMLYNLNRRLIKDLGNLSELRRLKIRFSDMHGRTLSDLLRSVGNLHRIQSLEIEHDCHSMDSCDSHVYHVITWDEAVALPRHIRHLFLSCFGLSRFPSCINPSFLISLSHLELTVTDMDEQSMRNLGGLPELRNLVLRTDSTVTVTNIAIDGCFQKLRSCKFFSSVVLFVLNEDSTVSFTLWNVKDDIVVASRNKDECRRAPVVMPNLQELLFNVERKFQGIYDILGLEYLTSLQKVTARINCQSYFCKAELTEAEVKLRQAIRVHPNHPKLNLERRNQRSAEEKWKTSDQENKRGKAEVGGAPKFSVTKPSFPASQAACNTSLERRNQRSAEEKRKTSDEEKKSGKAEVGGVPKFSVTKPSFPASQAACNTSSSHQEEKQAAQCLLAMLNRFLNEQRH